MASESCCNAGSPVDSQYEGSGEIVSLGDVDCYCNGSRDFGAPPTNGNVRRVVDHLASENCFVVMPDFYRGNCWAFDNFPPSDKDEFGAWWSSTASFENVYDVLQGGENSEFQCVASIHGARLTPNLAEELTVPCLLLPASDDPSIEPLQKIKIMDSVLQEEIGPMMRAAIEMPWRL